MSKYINAEELVEHLYKMLEKYPKNYQILAILEYIDSLQQEPRFPQYDNIVEKVFGAGNLEGWEFSDAEMLVALAKEELLKSLQQEQRVTKEQISHLEYWLAFFGCPEENIEKCATQIAQGYGAIRYLEGIQHGAEAVNKLAKQEKPDFDDVDPKHLVHSHYTKVRETKTGRVFWAEYSSEAAEWYEAGTGKAYSISEVEIVKEQPEANLEKEVVLEWEKCEPTDEGMGLESANIVNEQFDYIARHFYELGLNARKEE